MRGRLSASPALELEVKVYNINKGHNTEMVQKCGKLYGYSLFVDKVREYEREMPQEEAMKAAIAYYIGHDILKQFLETNSSEEFNMLIEGIETEREAAIKKCSISAMTRGSNIRHSECMSRFVPIRGIPRGF